METGSHGSVMRQKQRQTNSVVVADQQVEADLLDITTTDHGVVQAGVDQVGEDQEAVSIATTSGQTMKPRQNNGVTCSEAGEDLEATVETGSPSLTTTSLNQTQRLTQSNGVTCSEAGVDLEATVGAGSPSLTTTRQNPTKDKQ